MTRQRFLLTVSALMLTVSALVVAPAAQRRLTAPLQLSAKRTAALVAGCQDGVLANPQLYFQALIAGTDARQYRDVMNRIEPDLLKYGIWQQRSSGGEVRGRLFLPYAAPGYTPATPFFDHPVDVVENGAAWTWVDRGGPAYRAYPCSGEPPPPPPTTDLASRVERLESQLDAVVLRAGNLEARAVAAELRLQALEQKRVPTSCRVPYLGCSLGF